MLCMYMKDTMTKLDVPGGGNRVVKGFEASLVGDGDSIVGSGCNDDDIDGGGSNTNDNGNVSDDDGGSDDDVSGDTKWWR